MAKFALLLIGLMILCAASVVANPILNPIDNRTVAEGSSLNISLSNSNPDNGNTTYGVAFSPNRDFSTLSKISETAALLILEPGFSDSGNYTFTVTAEDSDSESSIVFGVIVTNTNRAPTIDLPGSRTIVTETTGELLLTQFSDDLDNDQLSFRVANESENQVNCTVENTRLIFAAAPQFLGNGSCTIEVSDGILTAQDTMQFVISQPNFLFGAIGEINFPEVFPGDSATRQITVRNAGTGRLTNVRVIPNVPSQYQLNLSRQDLGSLDPGASQVVSLRLTIPNATSSGAQSIGSLLLSSAETNRSINMGLDVGSRLGINDVDVTIDTAVDDSLLDGDTIDEKAQPLDKIEFDIEVENNFPTNSEIQIENIEVKVTIKDIDNGKDLHDKSSEFDLDAGDDESVLISFETPRDIEEKSFDVLIEVKGKDENGNRHNSQFSLKLRTDKNTHDIKIFSHSISPTKVKCGESALLRAELVNLGGKNEKKVRVTVQSPELGIDMNMEDLKIDENPDHNDILKSFSVTVPRTVASGTYIIEMKAYYDTNIVDDVIRENLEVSCPENDPKPGPEVPEKPAEDQSNGEGQIDEGVMVPPISVPPNASSQSQIVYATKKAPSSVIAPETSAAPDKKANIFAVADSPGYLIVLIVLAMIAMISLMVAFFYFQKKKNMVGEN